MGVRWSGLSFACAIVALASSCSNDYDGYEFVDEPGSGGGSGSGGTLGGSSGTGGSGGTLTGGSGGSLTGGTGGATGGSGGTSCGSDQKLCGTSCVPTDDPATGCGTASCSPCTIANASVQCAPLNGSMVCALLACNAGFDNCDGDLSNGCEGALDSVEHCGTCGRACSSEGSSAATCSVDKCEHTCNTGLADCSQPQAPAADDGCETDLEASNTNCGVCGNSCAAQGVAGGFVCLSGSCGCSASNQCVLSGKPGDASCDTQTGTCSCSGNACNPGEACKKSGPNSVCSCNNANACSAGQTCCPQVGCSDLTSDDANCGACGNACPSGTTCNAGTCA